MRRARHVAALRTAPSSRRSAPRTSRGRRAGATGPTPRRRAANRGCGWRNRRRTRHRWRGVTAPSIRICRRSDFQWNSSAACGFARQLARLAALAVGVEDEAVRPMPLEQHHPHRRAARRASDGRQRHRVGIVGLARSRLGEPGVEQGEGIVGHARALSEELRPAERLLRSRIESASQRRRPTMAARAYWQGQIRLALVSIPVEIYSATKSGAPIAFHQIHEPTGKRIKYEKVVPGIGPVDRRRDHQGLSRSRRAITSCSSRTRSTRSSSSRRRRSS